jgi:glutathione synthase/RimK-type ligase-like ATP-grasp enzyme
MWHYHHKDSKDILVARQLLCALEASGKTVYPDFKTNWYFDDKVGQKYLLEAIGAHLVPSYVFYSKEEALEWIDQTTFPKVFKLRRGSGSANVRLIRSRKEAKRITTRAFRSGFRQYDPASGLAERWRLFRKGSSDLKDLIEGLGRFIVKTRFETITGKERGYVYFQDFIAGCTFDIRTMVIGDKCYALKRMVRNNDFRASGSHDEIHTPEEIPLEVIKISFEISKKLHLQSVAFDFLITSENKPLVIEMSYAFGWDEGDGDVYWDPALNLHQGPFNPFGEMIENLIRTAKLKSQEG